MQLIKAVPPNLPSAPGQYERQYTEQLNKDLRLYFNRLNGNVNELMGTSGGGRYLYFPYGEFTATTTQAAAVANTPQIVDLTGGAVTSMMYYTPGDGIHVEQSGIYELSYSAQFTNSDSQEHDAALWLRRDSVDVANTASIVTVPKSHAGGDGKLIMAASFYISMQAEEHVELWWAANSTTVALETVAASSLPYTHPASPSVVITMGFVSNI